VGWDGWDTWTVTMDGIDEHVKSIRILYTVNCQLLSNVTATVTITVTVLYEVYEVYEV
jgi:hypothetical protein